ncbi:MAG: TM2 domain-containing protein [Candidatus Eremiobacteraeota bacterium]|nr:TM2 domain-containing protein [Candidatus Eremiobacteraeota bacterium]
MTPYAQMLLAHVRPETQGAYAYEYRRYAKDPAVALMLAVLLGVIGGESYYMGDAKRGILMSIALLSGIGLFVTVPMWLARCFTISSDCEAYNDYLAYTLACRYCPGSTAAPEPPREPASRPVIGGLPMRARA